MIYAQGADYSFWQDNNSTPQPVDFFQARVGGLSHAMIKTSQALYADPDHLTNWVNAKRWVYRAPYHFLVWDKSPLQQAQVYWSLLANDPPELPIWVDFEWWSTIPKNAFDILQKFLEKMKALAPGRPLGIYTAKSFWDQYGTRDSYWKQYLLWLCDISGPVEVPKPWDTWDWWQYTFKGDGPRFGAESKDLDLDYYNGTLEQMQARFNLAPLPEVTVVPSSSGRVLVDGLRMRTGPSVQDAMIGTLQAGTDVEILEQQEVGSDVWVRVSVDGWAAMRRLGIQYIEGGQ